MRRELPPLHSNQHDVLVRVAPHCFVANEQWGDMSRREEEKKKTTQKRKQTPEQSERKEAANEKEKKRKENNVTRSQSVSV